MVRISRQALEEIKRRIGQAEARFVEARAKLNAAQSELTTLKWELESVFKEGKDDGQGDGEHSSSGNGNMAAFLRELYGDDLSGRRGV